jgi:hypothetical protein
MITLLRAKAAELLRQAQQQTDHPHDKQTTPKGHDSKRPRA